MDAATERELDDLRFHWDDGYDITYDEKSRNWSARFKGADYELVGRTAHELRRAIRDDYYERRSEELTAIGMALSVSEQCGADGESQGHCDDGGYLVAVGQHRSHRGRPSAVREYVRRVADASGQRPEELSTKIYGERVVYDNPWVRLTLVDIEPPDGHRFEHHVVRLFQVAIALILNERDEVLMLWRHRFVADAWGWELPGGIIDGDEDGATCAAREAEEETGWRPASAMEHLVTYQPMIGMVDSPHEIYIGHGATLVGEPVDREEAGRIAWIPLADVLGMISRDEILGSGSLVGLLHVLASRRNDAEP